MRMCISWLCPFKEGSISSRESFDAPEVLPTRQLGARANQKPARKILRAGFWLVDFNNCINY